jgi:putative peptide zinc metalloprotease protein
MSRQIFSDSWHIVSSLRLSLLHTVTIQKQYFRGSQWFVVKDSFNNKFFRIKPEAYKFLMRLTTKNTVEEIWEEYLMKYPEITPTQEELVTLLSQLHINNLLYFKNRPKSDDMFERHITQEGKMLRSKILGFLFIKVPVFDPEEFLRVINPLTKAIFSLQGFIVWLFVIMYGVKTVIDNSNMVISQAQGVLSPNNLIFLYISLFMLKILHEFGHAMMCKKFGGPVHTIGIMFLIFTPLPYMDASSSWSFRNRWHRALVGSGGMLVELFFASISAVIWVNTGDGFLHNMSFNVMVVGSVSSLVFNANPLLKFDAYYMLSDILEIPNLFNRSKEQVYYYVEKYLFAVDNIEPPSSSSKEAKWLIFYSITSSVYRLLVSITIALFVGDQIFILGVFVAIMSIFAWIVKPLYSFFIYLFSSPKLNKNRYRAIIISTVIVSVLLTLIMTLPISYSINAPGVLYPNDFTSIYTTDDGYLEEVHIKSGVNIKKGDLIAIMSSRELDIEILSTKGKLAETQALKLNAQKSIADLQPLDSRVILLKKRLEWQEKRKKELLIYAPISGIWVSKEINKYKQSLLKKRELLGYIIPSNGFEFRAVVSQEKAYNLFIGSELKGSIKLNGIASKTIEVEDIYVIPYQHNQLPSPALGWFGGGDIKVLQNDSSGTKSVEAFFEIRGQVIENDNNPKLLYDRTGILRVVLPDMPIGLQFIKSVKQLMQKRYQL